MNNTLTQRILDKTALLGPSEAGRFFGVSAQTICNWNKGKSAPSIDAAEKIINEEINAAPAELTMWEGKNVQLLLPVYRTFSADTHFTLFANYAKYGPEKIGMIFQKRTVIHEARNMLVHKFLKSGAEWCIFVDDDMVLPCGNDKMFNQNYNAKLPSHLAGVNAISRIMSHGKDKPIVGALYYGRHRNGKAQVSDGFHSDIENSKLHDPNNLGEVRKVRWVATGFLRIHRSVFEKMATAAKEKWPHIIPSKEDKPTGFFTPDIVGQGEDVAFCLRAGAIGIPVHLDTGIVCLHTGECNYGWHNTMGQ